MTPIFFSLLGSLAQANFVWYGDFVVVMSGGGVDWPWVCTLAAQLASETELRKKKENEVDELRLLRDRLESELEDLKKELQEASEAKKKPEEEVEKLRKYAEETNGELI